MHRHDTLVPTFAKLVDYYHETGFDVKGKTIFEYALGKDFWTYHRERPSLHNGKSFHTPRGDVDARWQADCASSATFQSSYMAR